jgi:hypothetical protein
VNEPNIYLVVLGAIVRWAIVLVGGALVERHVLTGVEVERLGDDVVKHLMLAAPVLLPLAWSIGGKVRAHLQRQGWF